MAGGPPAALIASFQEHYQALLRFLTRRTGNGQHAADIAQETYLRLAGMPESSTIRDPRGFVFRVAGNLAIDMLRREARHNSRKAAAEQADALADPAPLPEAGLLAKQRLALLDEALRDLPPKPRRALLLSRLEGRTFAEIADELGVSESMVAKYIAQSLKACHRHLQEREGDKPPVRLQDMTAGIVPGREHGG